MGGRSKNLSTFLLQNTDDAGWCWATHVFIEICECGQYVSIVHKNHATWCKWCFSRQTI